MVHPWKELIVRLEQTASYRHAAEPFASPSPTSCAALASSLELARSARLQCLVGTTEASHYGCWRSCMPSQQLR
jgi:hypothetical protein